MADQVFDVVWRRIRSHAGEPFTTLTGVRFVYRVVGNTVAIERSDYGIARSNFERALPFVPNSGPAELKALVRGPAYVWSILPVVRIRQTDW